MVDLLYLKTFIVHNCPFWIAHAGRIYFLLFWLTKIKQNGRFDIFDNHLLSMLPLMDCTCVELYFRDSGDHVNLRLFFKGEVHTRTPMFPFFRESIKYEEIQSFIKIRVWEVVQMLICNKKMCVRSIKMSARSSCAKAGHQIIIIWPFHYITIIP